MSVQKITGFNSSTHPQKWLETSERTVVEDKLADCYIPVHTDGHEAATRLNDVVGTWNKCKVVEAK